MAIWFLQSEKWVKPWMVNRQPHSWSDISSLWSSSAPGQQVTSSAHTLGKQMLQEHQKEEGNLKDCPLRRAMIAHYAYYVHRCEVWTHYLFSLIRHSRNPYGLFLSKNSSLQGNRKLILHPGEFFLLFFTETKCQIRCTYSYVKKHECICIALASGWKLGTISHSSHSLTIQRQSLMPLKWRQFFFFSFSSAHEERVQWLVLSFMTIAQDSL